MGREVLPRLRANARETWPQLGMVTDAELDVFILARIPEVKLDENARSDDLLLACACARGARAAHDFLEEMTAEMIDGAHARIRPPGLTQAQARQLVWSRLLQIPNGGAARIALYKGEIELSAYVRGITTRLFLSLASGTKAPPSSLEDAILLHAAGNATLALDPELHRVKQTYMPGLRSTLAHTLTSLDARERAMLRDAIIEKDDLASMSLLYGASREAIASTLVAAKSKLEYRVKNRLAERMKISDRDHASLARCVSTQLDAALSRTRTLDS